MNKTFDIKLKLDKDFIEALSELKEKYGEEFEKLNGFHNSNLDFTDFIDNFIDSATVADSTIDSNSNSNTKDIRTLISDMMKPHTKLLSFNKIFYEHKKTHGLEGAKKWLEQEYNGCFYMHDAPSVSLMPYCFAYDLDGLVEKGLYFINNFKSRPAKHLTTFNDHVLEFISWTSNRTSGAVGLPSYLVYSWWFWWKDVNDNFYLKDPEYYRRQCFQKFVYDLNQPYLTVSECAFTNISIMDRPYLEEIFGGRVFPDGTMAIDHIEEILEHQKVFMEVVSEIREDCLMTFPVLTYSLLYKDGKFVDEEFAKWCSNHNTIWNDSNFFVSGDVTSLSSCCRLVNDFTKLKGFANSIGGTALKIGSIKVNTINLMRIALESGGDKDKYMEILEDRVRTDIEVLHTVRHIITRNIEKGLLPNYSYDVIDITKQYNTIGINAMYEVVRYFGGTYRDEFGNVSYTKEGIKLASDIMDKINEVKDSYSFDYSINIEAVPGERAAVVLCEKDNMLYPENEEKYHDFIYSNQWIPLTEQCSLDAKIEASAVLDNKCGGGQILHLNSQGKMTEEQAWDLLNYIAGKNVIYFAFNSKISVCKNGHGFIGDVCPRCGEPVVDTFQRIVGYLTPSGSYSRTRKKEFAKRYWYDLNEN